MSLYTEMVRPKSQWGGRCRCWGGGALTVGIHCYPGQRVPQHWPANSSLCEPSPEMDACLVMGERDVLDRGELKNVGAHAKGR